MDSQQPLKILIADDTDSDRLILESIVRREGHVPVSVADGKQAVAAFLEQRPDLVLMDALMPVMDGFEAAELIKAQAGDELVPIIFLTSLSDTESLVRCLEVGGDDFISKPYNRVILQAKIKAFMRMRDMHRVVQQQRDQISLHNRQLLQEQEVAKKVFDNIAHTGCLDAPNVKYRLSPLAIFNGDVIVAAIRPSGSMMVLLGDFTGHGLPAAVGAMPLANCFYGMVKKGFAMVDILREINQKLKQTLPLGVFCCATMVELNFHSRRARIWNGGLPDCVLYRQPDGALQQFRSSHLPLGILEDSAFKDDCLHVDMAVGDKIYLWSDGIIEARNKAGEMFGEERLLAILQEATDGEAIFHQILDAVDGYCGGERNDDLSLIELTMAEQASVVPAREEPREHRYSGLQEWALSLRLEPSTLRLFDPLPLLLSILVEVPGLSSYSGRLYTLLAELYTNALEHGVLQLDSSLKGTPAGFAEYYQLRQQRLADLSAGHIDIRLRHKLLEHGGELTITLLDSGPGFDYSQLRPLCPGADQFSGRGLGLIRQLSNAVEYRGSGSEVEVIFQWDVND